MQLTHPVPVDFDAVPSPSLTPRDQEKLAERCNMILVIKSICLYYVRTTVIFHMTSLVSSCLIVRTHAYVQVECVTTDLGTRRNMYREIPSSSLTHSR